jgi:hypothetical protein
VNHKPLPWPAMAAIVAIATDPTDY